MLKKQSHTIELAEQDKIALRITLTQEFEVKENVLMEQITSLTKDREEGIRKFQADFSAIQTEM